jgi:hypothetical protein
VNLLQTSAQISPNVPCRILAVSGKNRLTIEKSSSKVDTRISIPCVFSLSLDYGRDALGFEFLKPFEYASLGSKSDNDLRHSEEE